MSFEAGVDEVGRGPLAGPVYAAAVILDPKIKIKGLNDSKKLSKEKRNSLSDEIKENSICWNIASVEREIIDEINILQASLLAMKNAIKGLETKPDLVLVDGNNELDIEIASKAIINGDQEIECIMAASIIAKVARDKFMTDIDDEYPEYGFKKHKGYGTQEHLNLLKIYGPCNEHRDSFKPVIEAKKYNYSKFQYDLKIRSIVRDKLMTMNDEEIRTWLKTEETKSKDYAKELKKALNEEWIFIRDCSKLRNF
tara:strand:- start:5831 stop:6592 length:762 start_codon:yes stop_codon:yes gene_type:complete